MLIALLGRSFRPNTDDMRDSPGPMIISALQDLGVTTAVHDPASIDEAKRELKDVTFCRGPYDTLRDADALLVMMRRNDFRALDLANTADLMKAQVLVDLRNIYPLDEVMRHGFSYTGIGQ